MPLCRTQVLVLCAVTLILPIQCQKTDSVAAYLHKILQRLMSPSNFHYSLVLSDCGHEVFPPFDKSRVSVILNSTPTLYFGDRQREILVSCDTAGAVHLGMFSVNLDRCGHKFCSATGHRVEAINWQKRALVILRPLSLSGLGKEDWFKFQLDPFGISSRKFEEQEESLRNEDFLELYAQFTFVAFGRPFQMELTNPRRSRVVHRSRTYSTLRRHGLPRFGRDVFDVSETDAPGKLETVFTKFPKFDKSQDLHFAYYGLTALPGGDKVLWPIRDCNQQSKVSDRIRSHEARDFLSIPTQESYQKPAPTFQATHYAQAFDTFSIRLAIPQIYEDVRASESLSNDLTFALTLSCLIVVLISLFLVKRFVEIPEVSYFAGREIRLQESFFLKIRPQRKLRLVFAFVTALLYAFIFTNVISLETVSIAHPRRIPDSGCRFNSCEFVSLFDVVSQESSSEDSLLNSYSFLEDSLVEDQTGTCDAKDQKDAKLISTSGTDAKTLLAYLYLNHGLCGEMNILSHAAGWLEGQGLLLERRRDIETVQLCFDFNDPQWLNRAILEHSLLRYGFLRSSKHGCQQKPADSSCSQIRFWSETRDKTRVPILKRFLKQHTEKLKGVFEEQNMHPMSPTGIVCTLTTFRSVFQLTLWAFEISTAMFILE